MCLYTMTFKYNYSPAIENIFSYWNLCFFEELWLLSKIVWTRENNDLEVRLLLALSKLMFGIHRKMYQLVKFGDHFILKEAPRHKDLKRLTVLSFVIYPWADCCESFWDISRKLFYSESSFQNYFKKVIYIKEWEIHMGCAQNNWKNIP